ncbi:glycosyl transferase group 1 [Cellulomonas flavigena DSM 20109]|uniref:Glycosyl transferase group 1 n=1 Tax=Cellulomonas flavigena (strain ATCC 482 / DSM 20109 / BCRC 11376 / JCM 18109 / NBRC 3775 / NCIMB 8073 / NRS 134) TaxID=446466 RepID=D5UJB8_CELFN|nr:glycosyltransferase family 4 protein [Cellulomonas flavigena]ADG73641.1 glycosyl transferase group 1 [Cellulomonas flavigena DSM 20109]
MARRTVVHHVGRSGDVPGGMTQVVNAYLDWPFERCDVEVVESRGDPGDHVAGARGLVRALAAVRRLAAAPGPHVMVVHLSERGSFLREGAVLRYARRRGLPVVAHLHGADFAAFATAHPRLVRGVLRAADRVVTLSHETTRIVERFVDPARVHLVPNAVPSGVPVPKRRTVVFGGAVGYRKGVDVLQRAWRIAGPPPGWQLLVAGPVQDPAVVDATTPQTRFVGPLDHDDLLALLDAAAVAVLPSRDEGLPMFVLEAMARDACVVATDVGGIGPVLDGGCGVVVPPGDVGALAAALQRLTTDDAERDAIVQRARERFTTTYAAPAVYPRVEDLWLSAREGAHA